MGSWNAYVVSAAAQAILAGYLAVVLLRSARTPARRLLGRAMAALAGYAIALGISFMAPDPLSSILNGVCLSLAMLSAGDVASYVTWLARGARAEDPPRLPLHLTPVNAGLALLLGIGTGGAAALGRAVPSEIFVVELGLLLLLSLAAVVAAGLAAARGARGGRAMLYACALPLIPTTLNLSSLLGASLVDPTTYLLLRDLAILAYTFAVLVAYLDHGHEPMSLEARLVAGALTIVLAIATIAGHLLEPWVASIAYDFEAASRASSDVAEAVLVLMIAGCLGVIVLVPRLFRRSVLAPIDRLSIAVARVEAGELVRVESEQQDELGRLTRSFNQMVAARGAQLEALDRQVKKTEAKRAEVEALNAELRHQVAARSRQVAEVLARFDPGEAGFVDGEVVDGRYRVEGRLGAGGMGIVYAVRRTGDSRGLALKVMASQASREEAVRFAREAELAAELDDPRLVSVIDVGVHEGRAFLVMERVDGGSLEDARSRFGDVAWALPILAQIAGGLAALHARGIVHRDLKPANVLLDLRGETVHAKITDFGIARRDVVDAMGATAAVGSDEVRGATGTGAVLGTLAYMAPELGRGTATFPPSVDLFSFGVLAYELLETKSPFDVPPVLDAMGGREVAAPQAAPAGVPSEIGARLRDCLATEPSARPTAEALAAMLDRWAPAVAPPSSQGIEGGDAGPVGAGAAAALGASTARGGSGRGSRGG